MATRPHHVFLGVLLVLSIARVLQWRTATMTLGRGGGGVSIQHSRISYQELQVEHHRVTMSALAPETTTSEEGELLLLAAVSRRPNDNNDFLQYKSCLQSPSRRIALAGNYAVPSYDCRDCGSNKNQTEYKSREDCPKVLPRGWCQPFRTNAWNVPPRQQSYHDPTVPQSHSHLIRHWTPSRHWPSSKIAYEQIPCETYDECWDYSRCLDDDKKIAVYVYDLAHNKTNNHNNYYKWTATNMLDKAVAAFPAKLRRVSDPQRACLLIVMPQSIDSDDNITTILSHPAYGDGSNHLIWTAHRAFGHHGDFPFHEKGNYGKASIATATFMRSQIRPGHDIPLGLEMKVRRNTDADVATLATTTKRDILLLFKGNVYDWGEGWWQHRYLAVEYWEHAPDIVVDVECRQRNYTAPRTEYAKLLSSSIFSFCPGGGSTNTFRFSESLAMGAIPIVLPDFVPPYWPEYDWSGCLIVVTEARIIDLPRYLRTISDAEIQQRRLRCAALYPYTAITDDGTGYSDDTAFITAMHVWIWRIRTRREQYRAFVQKQLELERKQAKDILSNTALRPFFSG